MSKIVFDDYRGRSETHIMAVEIMATLASLGAFSDAVRGSAVRVWKNNVGGVYTLRKASASQEDHNLLVYVVWFVAGRPRCALGDLSGRSLRTLQRLEPDSGPRRMAKLDCPVSLVARAWALGHHCVAAIYELAYNSMLRMPFRGPPRGCRCTRESGGPCGI